MTTPDASSPDVPYGAHTAGNGPSGLTLPAILVVVLMVVTLGVFGVLWHYMANRELSRFHPSIEVEPWLAALSLLVPVAGLVSIYNTGRRIQQAQALAGLKPTCVPLLGGILGWLFLAHTVYYQAVLNSVWKNRRL